MVVVAHFNVRSLMAPGKLAELKLSSSMHEPDVLCVTETWLTNKHLDQTLAIPGYQLPIRCDRKFSRGGGVAIYLRNGLAVSRLPIDATTELSQVFEHVAIRLDFPKRKTLYVFAVYRPPKQDMEVFLDCLEKAITPYSHKNVLLVGDFNAKHMDWYQSQATDAEGERLKAFTDCQKLFQLGEGPTFKCPTSSHQPLLDLIFTNRPANCASTCVLPPLADHCAVTIYLSLKNSQRPKPYRSE